MSSRGAEEVEFSIQIGPQGLKPWRIFNDLRHD